MDKEKLKLIVRNLESLVGCLKSEIYSDVNSYHEKPVYEEIASYIHDYDEVFYDDEEDSFPGVNKKYRITNDDDGDGL